MKATLFYAHGGVGHSKFPSAKKFSDGVKELNTIIVFVVAKDLNI